MNRSFGIGWVYGLSTLGLALVVISLLGNIVGSFTPGAEIGEFTLKNYRDLATDPDLMPVFLRTLVLGFGTVFVLMIFAFPFAWILARTDFPWKGILFTVLAAKLAIPGFITAMAYVWMFNPTAGLFNKLLGAGGGAVPYFDVYQMSWICFLQGIVLVPGAVFMMLPAFRNMDGSLEEAAWVSGVTRWLALRRIILPLLKPGILAVLLFFFVIAVEMFDIVGLIGMPGGITVLVVWIYDVMHPADGLPNFGFAGAAGVLLFAVCGIAIIFYIRFLRQSERFAVIGGKSRQFTPQALGRWRWAAAAFVALWVIAAVALPLATLIWVSLIPYLQTFSMKALGQMNLESYYNAVDYMEDAVLNTVIVVVGAVAVSTVFSTCISWVVTRSRSAAATWSDGLVFLAPAVPAIVSAVAFQYMGIAIYKWIPLYGTIWLIAIALGTRMLAYCTRTMNTASLQIRFELDEAARASGVTPLVAFRRVFLPLMRPAIFYSGLLVGMLAARDLTLPLMMNVGDTHTLSTLIFDLQINGDQGAAAAISIYLVVVLVIVAVIAHRLAGLGEPGILRQRNWRLPRLLRRRPALAGAAGE